MDPAPSEKGSRFCAYDDANSDPTASVETASDKNSSSASQRRWGFAGGGGRPFANRPEVYVQDVDRRRAVAVATEWEAAHADWMRPRPKAVLSPEKSRAVRKCFRAARVRAV